MQSAVDTKIDPEVAKKFIQHYHMKTIFIIHHIILSKSV